MDPAALERLHGLIEPAPVPLTPQTWGWWVVGVVALLLLAWAGWLAWRRYQRGAYRRAALGELATLDPALERGDPAALQALSPLLKRVALRIAPRDQVAGLGGDAWLAFLDSRLDGEGFRAGPGRHLLTIDYRPPARAAALPAADRKALVRLVRAWLEGHRA